MYLPSKYTLEVSNIYIGQNIIFTSVLDNKDPFDK